MLASVALFIVWIGFKIIKDLTSTHFLSDLPRITGTGLSDLSLGPFDLARWPVKLAF